MKNISVPRVVIAMIVVVFLTLSSFFTVAQTQSSKPVYQRLYTTLGGYQESLPVDYNSNPGKKYPLLIFLHGSGEKGDGSAAQLPRVLRNGPFKFIEDKKFPDKFKVNEKEFSFIVVAPQVNGSSASNAAIGALITHCLQTYRVDEDRIYITGLSLGGLMSYNFVGSKKETADKIAAALLVCPNAVSNEGRAANIATSNLPVWLTNNDGDDLAKIDNAIKTVNMININNPSPKTKITIFNKTGHDAWTKTYDPNFKEDGMNVYEWMLSYTRIRNGSIPPPVVVTAPPVVDAGNNKIIVHPLDSVTLDGVVSVAASTSVKSYEWKYAKGPVAPVIVNGSQKSTLVKTLAVGTHVFTLKVTDANNNSSSDSVSVLVKPAPVVPIAAPVVEAGDNKNIILPLDSVTLDATVSVAAGVSIKSYEWTYLSGPAAPVIVSASQKNTLVKKMVPGTYVFALKVIDINNNSNSDTVSVLVQPATVVPTTPVQNLSANAGEDLVVTMPVNSVALNGTASVAGTGQAITAYTWIRLSAPKYAGSMSGANNAVMQVTDLVPGLYSFQLTVKDNGGNSKSDTVNVTVNYKTGNLRADAGRDTTITLAQAKKLKLDGGNSTAPDGSVVSCGWSRISGPGSSGALFYPSSNLVTTPSTLVAGVYEFQLTVSDNKRNKVTDKVTITVTDGAVGEQPQEPVRYLTANAGVDQVVFIPVDSAVLHATESFAGTGNTITSYLWKRLSGTQNWGNVVSSKNPVTATTAMLPGMYSYQLTVTDNLGETKLDTVNIVVKYGAGGLKANAGKDTTITLAQAKNIVLNGSLSTAPNGSNISCGWTRISGPGSSAALFYPSTNIITNTTTKVAGVYVFQLTVGDDKRNRSTARVTVTVVDPAVSARTTVSEKNNSVAAEITASKPADVESVKLSVYPNPVTTDARVQLEGAVTGNGVLKVYDLQGKLVKQKSIVKDAAITVNATIETGGLPVGAYILQVELNGNIQKATRFIKL